METQYLCDDCGKPGAKPYAVPTDGPGATMQLCGDCASGEVDGNGSLIIHHCGWCGDAIEPGLEVLDAVDGWLCPGCAPY